MQMSSKGSLHMTHISGSFSSVAEVSSALILSALIFSAFIFVRLNFCDFNYIRVLRLFLFTLRPILGVPSFFLG
jgi:hypothetical protein